MTLAELGMGRSGVVRMVHGRGPSRLRLLDMGLTPGTQVTLLKTAPLGDPIEIGLRGYVLSLRREDARKIELEEASR